MNFIIIIFAILLFGCDKSDSNIYEAIDKEDIPKIEKLLNSPKKINQRYYDGWTPLTLAASKGKIAVIEILVKNGADVNYLEDGGNSAVFWAAYYNHYFAVKTLLESGANPCVKGKLNLLPVEIAKKKGFTKITEILSKCQNAEKN